MNCRQRALAALDHKEPDRVPLDFGGRHTTLHRYAHRALMQHLGLTGPEMEVFIQQEIEMIGGLLKAIGLLK